MTPKNLFNTILKIFGLFFLREIVLIIPMLISSIPYLTDSDGFGGSRFSSGDIIPFIVNLVALAFYVLIIHLLLFKTNKIIDLLKLHQGFNQQEFSFNMSTSLVLTISLIVIGGVILISEIPNFCRSVFSYFKERSLTHGITKLNYSYIITSGVKIILGLLIIGERKRIVQFAERRKVKKEDIEMQ